MSDECKHCMCRGDIEYCESVDCNHHDNWYVTVLKKTIEELEKVIDNCGGDV